MQADNFKCLPWLQYRFNVLAFFHKMHKFFDFVSVWLHQFFLKCELLAWQHGIISITLHIIVYFKVKQVNIA